MNCAENLLRDHDDIVAIVRALAASGVRLEADRYVDPAMLCGIDGFLRDFVVGSWFWKQESILLPHVRAVLPDESALAHTCSALRAQCLPPIEDLHRAVARLADEDLPRIAGDVVSKSRSVIERVTACLEAERPLLYRLRRRAARLDDAALIDACVEIERRALGATGREWYAQLAADYADIARSWTAWPAAAAAPAITSRTRSRLTAV